MPGPKFPTEDEDLGPLSLDGPALSARTYPRNPGNHDVVLQGRIWDQLRATRELDVSEVSIVVKNRSATLFGSVPDEGQRAQVERIAIRISGVLQVSNRLHISAPTH